MTAAVTQATEGALVAARFGPLSTVPGLIAILLLLVLLILKELVRAAGGDQTAERLRALDIAIVPLLCAFVVVIGIRLARLLHLL